MGGRLQALVRSVSQCSPNLIFKLNCLVPPSPSVGVMPDLSHLDFQSSEAKLEQVIDLLPKRYNQTRADDFNFAVEEPTMWSHVIGIRFSNLTAGLDDISQVSVCGAVFLKAGVEQIIGGATKASCRWALANEHYFRSPHEALNLASCGEEPGVQNGRDDFVPQRFELANFRAGVVHCHRVPPLSVRRQRL